MLGPRASKLHYSAVEKSGGLLHSRQKSKVMGVSSHSKCHSTTHTRTRKTLKWHWSLEMRERLNLLNAFFPSHEIICIRQGSSLEMNSFIYYASQVKRWQKLLLETKLEKFPDVQEPENSPLVSGEPMGCCLVRRLEKQ